MNLGGSWFAIIWRWGYVLWVCRVAVVSTIAGAVLLAGTSQARDLFADIGITWWKWIVYFLLVFAWAWIVHAAARRALQYDDWVPEAHGDGGISKDRREALQKLFWRPAMYVPRALSIVVFGAVLGAVVKTRLNLETAVDGLPEARQAINLGWILMAGTVAIAVVYILLIWRRRKFGEWVAADGTWLYSPPLLAGIAPVFASILPPGYQRRTPPAHQSLLDIAVKITRVVVLAFLLVAIVNPNWLATTWPRLFFVPVLFGGMVVLLSELGAWSLRWRTPLLLGVVVVSVICVFLTTSFHDARWIEDKAFSARNISMAQAVERWKAANKCSDADQRPCPRPILIAGAGGASRAAFLTATVVGALIDLGLDPAKAEQYGDVRSRIFAMSTVSGSSVGAVVMRAAFHDAAERKTPNQPPCKFGGTGSWFGLPYVGQNFDPTKSWRDCFQAILAGDFLSPVFVALAYRDNFPMLNPVTGRPMWSDRAVLLEQAFERRYHRFTADGAVPESCPDEAGASKPGFDGLCRPFGHHPDPKAAGAWVPLLLINGSSVFTGRRIVVSDVKASDSLGVNRSFLPLAYDLSEIRLWQKPGSQKPAVEKGDNIRLSTAATMSARFPIVSPHGLLRNLQGDIHDHIVDGGYFENDGLATIADVASVLREEPYKLDPVVIRIVNAPSGLETLSLGPDRPSAPAAEERGLFDDVFSIVRALLATRSGHEDGHEAYLRSQLTNGSRLYPIGVYELEPPTAAPNRKQLAPWGNPFCRLDFKKPAKLEAVSMSWWVSQPVQAYLDAQLCVHANWVRLECELRVGRTGSRDDCKEP